MSSAILLGFSILFFTGAYFIYGKFIAGRLAINDSNRMPSKVKQDGVDFMPAKRFILLGHHFASIAGVGPIVGPILGASFGWGPVFLWILFGSVFFGAVHDFTSLIASVRHEGKSIGGIMEYYLGKRAKKMFLVFAWFALILIIAVFAIVIAGTLKAAPQAASSSGIFLIIAVVMGWLLYVKKVNVIPVTIAGVILLYPAISAGTAFPLQFEYNTWIYILLAYIIIASVTPVWLLLQPRDYLNSFLLYIIIIIGVLGVFFNNPAVTQPFFTSFYVKGMGLLFPILFVTVACGAISGFHSIVASGTTSKQIEKESDAKFIGYGGMLIEGVLAVIALVTVASVLNKTGGVPGDIFASGFGVLSASLGIPEQTGRTFASLAISAFALTTIDTTARLGRYTFQEFFEDFKGPAAFLKNKYAATIITVAAASLLAVNKGGTMSIWPLFGAANQMLAALALLTVTAYLSHKGIKNGFVKVPAAVMFVITVTASAFLVFENFKAGKYHLAVIALLLLSAAASIVSDLFLRRKENDCIKP